MRETLKGANSKSEKYEAEKEALMKTLNDQRMNDAANAKEVQLHRPLLTSQSDDLLSYSCLVNKFHFLSPL